MYKIEDYVGCIIKVLNKYSLPREEFWDIGMIALEKAIKKFDQSRTTNKPQTYFIYQIEWHIAKEIENIAIWCGFVKKHSGRHYIWFLLNYKEIINYCFNFSLDNLYIKDDSQKYDFDKEYKQKMSEMTVQDFYDNCLTETEATICKMRVEGYTLEEIGKVLGCARQNISMKLPRIKRKMIEYFGEEKCNDRFPKRNKPGG